MARITLNSILVYCLCIFSISCSNNSSHINTNLIPVKSGEKWGYINKKGEYIINPQFQDAEFFRDGLAKVQSIDGKYGFISEDGKYKIPAKYKDGTPFKNGLAFVVSDGGYPTCIDNSGEIKFVLKQAKYAFWFTEDLAMFQSTDDKFGFVDPSGKVVINAQFESARPFNEGYAAIYQNKKWGFIDKKGKIVINPQFEGVMDFYNNKAVFYNNKQCGYIDTKGSYIINPQFDGATSFNEGFAIIISGNNVGYINEEGKIEINPQFNNAGIFSNGLAYIEQDKKYGFIDKKGKIVINPQFDDASPFFGDVAFVKSADKWGIIDIEGKYLVNPQFESMKQNTHEYALKCRYNLDYALIPSVKTDFYDASILIGTIKKRINDTSFDGFNASTTLQNIVDNPIYGENVDAVSEYEADCQKSQEITKDISIRSTAFYFLNPIYTMVSDGWWGSKKQYNLSEKLAVIQLHFDLSGDASDKGNAISSALQDEISKSQNLKFTTTNGQYTAYQEDGKLSFAIVYTEFSVSMYIGFSQQKLQELLNKSVEENVD